MRTLRSGRPFIKFLQDLGKRVRTGPLSSESGGEGEGPLRIAGGWHSHSGDAGVCLWAVQGATELRALTVAAFCAA